MTERWDCYSPVALVFWRAADRAETGDAWPVFNAFYETPGGPPHELQETIGTLVWARFGNPFQEKPVPNVGVVCGLRDIAEFGPAGRPR